MGSKVLLTAGGTGGHLFPAIALAEDLSKKHACDVLFAAGHLAKNPYFAHESFAFREVSCEPFRLAPWQFLKASFSLFKAVIQSVGIIREFKPDLVIGFGSYYTLPVLIASKILRKPIFLHEANSVPGRVNRFFSLMVEKTWVHFPETQSLIRGPSAYGGMPLRSNLKKGIISKEEARRKFQLSPDLTTFLVFGGSQGAKKINAIFSEATLFHLKGNMGPFQVIHFTGTHEDAEQLMGRYVCAGIPAYIRPFEKRMEIAWSAADISITRAGAASIAEQLEFEVPGILIPYPLSTDEHQEKNADFLVDTKLAVKISETGLTPASLAGKILELLVSKDSRLEEFQEYKQKMLQVSLSEKIINWLDERIVK